MKLIISIVAAVLLSGCSNSSGGGATNGPSGNPNRLNWEAVPATYHPEIKNIDFNLNGAQRIYMDIAGFAEDVEVVYGANQTPNVGSLHVYTVWAESASFGGTQVKTNGTNLNLEWSGSYQCEIGVTNGQITKLKGGCYVRLQVVLPPGTEIEVYNLGQLISKRFFAMDTETFLKNFDHATWSKDKFAAIEDFLASYSGLTSKPALTAQQMGTVVHGFAFSEEKFQSLRRLHVTVWDRQNLGAMIDQEFGYFDRDSARQIVGI